MLDSGRRVVAGRLRVSMSVLFGRKCVAPILIRIADAHPRLALDLHLAGRLVDVVERGFDLVVRNGALLDWPGLNTRRIARQPMRVCAAPAYLRTAGIPQSLADLAGHRAILCGSSDRPRSWQFPQPGGKVAEIILPSGMHIDDVGAIRDAALDGHGLA